MSHQHSVAYWVAKHASDPSCCSIRDETRQKVEAQLKAFGLVLRKIKDFEELVWCSEQQPMFAQPIRITVDYNNRMDLIKKLLGEGFDG